MCEEKYILYHKKILEIGIGLGDDSIPDVDTFLNIKTQIKGEVIPIFEDIIKSLLGLKKLPLFKPDNVVQGITYGLNNIDKKINNDNFYKQNAVAFIQTVNNLLQATESNKDIPFFKDKDPKDYITEACIKEHMSLLKNLVFDSCIFIQDLFIYKKIRFEQKCWSSSHNPLFLMSSELHKLLYGNHTPLSREDMHIYPAISTLRIMIEVKIRYALGIIGLKNKMNNTIDPIPLSKILLTLDKYVKNGKVFFSVSYENIKKIYSWTNIYIHSGHKGYIWYPFIFEEYLSPFFHGRNVELKNSGWNIKAGIRIKKSDLEQIRKDIENPMELLYFDDEKVLEAVIID